VKRLMREAIELSEPTDEYSAHPLEDNLFEWHFTMRGPQASEFDGGIYHGRILLPTEYPMKPPNIILLTVRNNKCNLTVILHNIINCVAKWSMGNKQKNMLKHFQSSSRNLATIMVD